MFNGVPQFAHCKTLYWPFPVELVAEPGVTYYGTMPGCIDPNFVISTNKDGSPRIDAGFEYGATIWKTFAKEAGSIELVFALSTHNPYHVVLMRTTITAKPLSKPGPG